MSVKSKRMVARSGSMECPICLQKRRLVEHHIHGRSILEKNRLWNRAYVCPSCHDDIHSGAIVLEGYVMTSDGKKLLWHKKGDDPVAKNGATPPLYAK